MFLKRLFNIILKVIEFEYLRPFTAVSQIGEPKSFLAVLIKKPAPAVEQKLEQNLAINSDKSNLFINQICENSLLSSCYSHWKQKPKQTVTQKLN